MKHDLIDRRALPEASKIVRPRREGAGRLPRLAHEKRVQTWRARAYYAVLSADVELDVVGRGRLVLSGEDRASALQGKIRCPSYPAFGNTAARSILQVGAGSSPTSFS